jgi:predicted nuclease with TOPRIM domain
MGKIFLTIRFYNKYFPFFISNTLILIGIFLAQSISIFTIVSSLMIGKQTQSLLVRLLLVLLVGLCGCGGIRSENETLKEEITDISGENDKLKRELNILKSENSKLHIRLAQLNLQISSLQIELQNLQKDIDVFRVQLKGAHKKNKKS